jgi:DNA replication and repair protein RecF
LRLRDFRCYETLRLESESEIVVLHGPNGAGKTNLLEALSFL